MPDAKYCPREPTPEMCTAGCKATPELYETLWLDMTADIWRAMYDAAPAQAEPRESHTLKYPRDAAHAAPEGYLDALTNALRAYKQADMDGVMVLVSRQACEEGADAIAALRARAEQAEADKARLDWLDRVNAETNARNGTVYGWKFDINHNRAALSDHNLPALSVRAAIDRARTQGGDRG